MKRIAQFALFSALLLATAPAGAQTATTEPEAHAIAVDAYQYFYSPVSVDLTRRVATNIEAGKIPGFGPANMFHSFQAFPTAEFKTVVRPNFDTLYSSAFLDMTKEPVVVSAPETNGRYYLLPMLDMWTRCFRLAGVAYDWHTRGQFSRHAARLERGRSVGNDADQRADALCLGHRTNKDRWATGLRRRS